MASLKIFPPVEGLHLRGKGKTEQTVEKKRKCLLAADHELCII